MPPSGGVPARPAMRVAIAALVAAILGAGVGVGLRRAHPAPPAHVLGQDVVPPHPIGPVTLLAGDGSPVTLSTVLARMPANGIALVFFGYTHCTDVCPRMLSNLTRARRALGHDADRATIVFITTDPARDSPSVVQAYTRSFDSTIVGLAGTPAEIDSAQTAFDVLGFDNGPITADAHERGPVHPVSIYMADPRGQLRHVLPVRASPQAIDVAVRALW